MRAKEQKQREKNKIYKCIHNVGLIMLLYTRYSVHWKRALESGEALLFLVNHNLMLEFCCCSAYYSIALIISSYQSEIVMGQRECARCELNQFFI